MGVCVGCGLYINPGTGLLEVERAPGGGLTCTDAGLAVAFPASQTGSSTFDASTGQVIRSSDDCQGLETRGNGLWAPKACTVAGNEPRGYFGIANGQDLSSGGNYDILNFGGAVSITNPEDCRLFGMWDVQAFGGRVEAQPGFDAYAFVSVNMKGLGWGVSTPVTYIRMDNLNNNVVVNFDLNNLWETNFVVFDPNEVGTIEAKVTITVTAGSGDWYDNPFFPGFEFHWHLTPQGSC